MVYIPQRVYTIPTGTTTGSYVHPMVYDATTGRFVPYPSNASSTSIATIAIVGEWY